MKICGLMREEDVKMCVRYGADIIGFVVEYPRPVPWNLTAERAKALIRTVEKPAETCIVTGGSKEKILNLVLEMKPDYVQLHGGESLEDTAWLVGEMKKRGVKVIKAVFPDTPDLLKAATDFCAAGVDALLLDPRAPGNAKSGGAADLAAYMELQSAVSCPVILAGGLTPENAAEAVRETGAQMIDLMTGVERSYGVKDEKKVAALFQSLESGIFD